MDGYNWAVDLNESFDLFEQRDTITVSDLCRAVGEALSPVTGSIHRVRCTVSSAKRNQRGHIFFDMVDAMEVGGFSKSVTAKMPAVIWSAEASVISRQLAQRSLPSFADDLEVVVVGKLNFHVVYGMRFQVLDLDYDALRRDELIKLEEIRRALKKEGLWDRNRSLPAPYLPLKIALVTSASGVVKQDFINPLLESGLNFAVRLYPTSVAGPYAVGDLVQTLEMAGRGGHDLIVLIRGGGGAQELSIFNEEKVVRAVAESPLPIWCAIGHSTDSVLVNEVASRFFDVPQSVAKELTSLALEYLRSIMDSAQRVAFFASKVAERELELLKREKLRVAMAYDSFNKRLLSSLVDSLQNIRHEASTLLSQQFHALAIAVGTVTESLGRELATHKTDILESLAEFRFGLLGLLRDEEAGIGRSLAEFRFGLLGLLRDEELDVQRYPLGHGHQLLSLVESEGRYLSAALGNVVKRDPEEPLRAGFAMVSDAEGRWVVSAAQAVSTGVSQIRFIDGGVPVKVVEE
ncbi:Exodeoxyribonuclease VII large subunit [Ferrithrix thermotolerans DSM 19514]|uniref:Exodeoxyribonuclease 7 large subunit n=1 Tax=Ferrithrix thermotolerans DSM 19514 TaxID=1121881 RepID=A0A1M4T254_9ACTN|nr:Exodeoxyribonuclease VII large subunit [Ferrithrix thermotolerans DSM 19514]